MKKGLLIFLKKNYVFIIMILLVIARLLLGRAIGGWYGLSETYDDVAMMNGLNPERFVHPNHLTLIKDLSFSVFLGISAITGLPYTIFLSLFWALTAFVVWLLAGKVTKNKWVRLFAFAYILFLPIAFTSWGGLRIYRNAVIAPSIILTFSLILWSGINIAKGEKLKKSIWTAIIAGLVFSFSYYLKEDGIWMMACLVVSIIVELLILIHKVRKKRGGYGKKTAVKWGLICLIPFLVWFGWTSVYKGVNHAFFGVYETNTRTNGELGRFVENIYKIDSPGRSYYVWAPLGAIEKAFEVSPTLGAHKELLEEIKTTGFQPGGLEKNPIGRDFLSWIMRSELIDSGLWTSEEEVNEMFKQVNSELNSAFNNGTLKKAEGRLQLLASTGGYTWEEIKNSNILEQIGMSFEDSIWFTRYTVGFDESDVRYGTKRGKNDATKVNRVLHMTNDVNVVDKPERAVARVVIDVIMWVYRIINTILVIIMICSYIYYIVGIIKNRKTLKRYVRDNRVPLICATISFTFLCVAIAYSFATAWFFIDSAGQFNNARVFVFYAVGVPGLFTMSLMPIIGCNCFTSKAKLIKEKICKRKKK